MRKTIKTIITYGFILFILTSCGINKNKFDIGGNSNIKPSEENITLYVKKNTLTKTGATLILKNDSDIDVQYGTPYEIQIKKDGEWHKINVELNFILPAFELKAKETKEIELNWENGYGKLSSGDYRILKSIDREKEDGTFDTFYISAEFSIE